MSKSVISLMPVTRPVAPARARVYQSVLLASYLARDHHMAPYGAAVLANAVADEARRDLDEPATTIQVVALEHATAPVDAVDQVLAGAPDLVGLSLYVWNYSQTLALAAGLRRARPDLVLVVGGPHVSRDDERLTRALADGVVDCCIAGEGEAPFLDILTQPVDSMPAFVDGKGADFSGRTSPYLTQNILRAELDATKTVVVEGSRGCPFTCTFCDQGWRKARLADDAPLRVEMQALYDLGARHYIFLDPTFNYHRTRMHGILEFMRAHLPGATFSAELKVELLKDDDIKALRGLCTFIEAGLQTVHPETQRIIRRRENLEDLWYAASALVNAQIDVAINTIYGLPGETLADWLATINVCYANTTAQITSTCLKVLPNTEIWSQRATFGYTWDENDLFRARKSSSMSEDDFRRADALSRALSGVQSPGIGVIPEARGFLAANEDWLLSDFLIALVDDQLTLRVRDDGERRTLEFQPAVELTC